MASSPRTPAQKAVAHLRPEGALYRETIAINGKTGIAIDGPPRFNAHLLVVDGRMQRMGRSPTKLQPFPEPEALRDGEFAWKGIGEKTGYLYVEVR